EEAQHLSTDPLPTRLLVVHNAGRGGHDDNTELTRGKKTGHPPLNLAMTNVIAGRDDTALVESAVKLNHNLARAVVVNVLKFANVTMLHHQRKKLNDHLGCRPEKYLPLATLLGIVHGLKRVPQDADAHHLCWFGSSNSGK
ncbi:hypothetical protein Vafri_11846, partial [Volvox africanus]